MTEMTQTGLSENSAGALSYVTIIPAIIFLVMPPYNKSSYIRFHAWQSVFFTVACIVLWVALIIVRVILSSIPFIGLMIYPLMLAVRPGRLHSLAGGGSQGPQRPEIRTAHHRRTGREASGGHAVDPRQLGLAESPQAETASG
jgi:uncharacterized membrane protein